MTYFRRGSEHCELMRCTFSVMFSIVRFLSSGTDAVPGPPAEAIVMCSELTLVRIVSQTIGGMRGKEKNIVSIRMNLQLRSEYVKHPVALHTC